MAIYLASRKRADEVADKKEADKRAHKDLVRLYADPLKDAVTSLKHRLHEIVEKKQSRYLRSDAPNIPFLEYKRISTLYRIAALLGWIRAIRRERSYLDPDQASASSEMQAIAELEGALADGTHVELQRLEELLGLWRVHSMDEAVKSVAANLVDGERAEYLAGKGVLGARDLTDADQVELAERCAAIVRQKASVDIPKALVKATAGEAAVIFGIKEAYIYRDWQAAIGDLMLLEDKTAARHFSVLGFGAFENMFLEAATQVDEASGRWFGRLQALVHDLDMAHEGMFDARREQIRKLYQCCAKLESALVERLSRGDQAKP
ncbi:hypothetical protein D3876_02180 [Sphingomonas cavernae]|uniref:Uncharacterized protein n=2 Tax=Sphingomonas cavernae TaxID=2320861 RepID=A0A418WPN7_9SPHN|nr:hypothetical protein D3876_02180 [Sphingomonas cavernae]